MTIHKPTLYIGMSLIVLLFACPSRAQQQSSTEDLRKEVQALSQAVKAMQKDLQDIKAMLSRMVPEAPPDSVVLDLGNHPVRGDRAAKLVLVEFSDYQ